MKERLVFTIALAIGRIAGYCPVQRQAGGSFVFQLFSWPGITFIVLGLTHVLYIQTLIPVRIFQTIDAFSEHESFEKKTAVCLALVVSISLVWLYIGWFSCLSNILKVWNSIEEYDKKQNITQPVESSHFSLWKNVVTMTIILAGAVAQCWKGRLHCLKYAQDHQLNWSLLLKIAEFQKELADIISIVDILGRAVLYYFAGLMLSVSFSAISGRLEQICEDKENFHDDKDSIFYSEDSVFIRINNQLKQRPVENFRKSQYDKLIDQIQNLEELFLSFSTAWSHVFIFMVGFSILILAMTMFIISRAIVGHDLVDLSHAATVCLGVMTWMRMMLLGNGAEALEQNGILLKRKVMQLSQIPGACHSDVVNLKLYVRNLDFKISVSGYFVLQRSLLISILSAAITYTVILVQFNLPEN